MKELIKDTFSAYFGLTLIIPIMLSIVIIFISIIGIETTYTFTQMMEQAWFNYYLFGKIGGIEMYKVHLGGLFLTFVILLISKQ